MQFIQTFFLCLFVVINTTNTPVYASQFVRQGDELLRQENAPAASMRYTSQMRATMALADFRAENLKSLMRTSPPRLYSYVAYFKARRGLSEIDVILGQKQKANIRRVSDIEQLSAGIRGFRAHADRLREKAINGGGMRALRKKEVVELLVLRSYLCLLGDNEMARRNYQAAATSYLAAEYYSHSTINHPSNYPGSNPSYHSAGGGWDGARCYLWGQAYANFKLHNWPRLAEIIGRIASPVESERRPAEYKAAVKSLTLQLHPRGVAPHQARAFEDIQFNQKIASIVQDILKSGIKSEIKR